MHGADTGIRAPTLSSVRSPFIVAWAARSSLFWKRRKTLTHISTNSLTQPPFSGETPLAIPNVVCNNELKGTLGAGGVLFSQSWAQFFNAYGRIKGKENMKDDRFETMTRRE